MRRDRGGTAERRGAWRFGRLAESACAWWLRLKGYRIVARGFRVPAGEIDIVARRGRTLAFVEVKARTGDGAWDALTPSQRRRIVRAAEAFLKARPAYAGLDLRFDLMVVGRRRRPRHLTNAWTADG
ncbi:MAG: YraN family protein [Rhodospirillales bacterium]